MIKISVIIPVYNVEPYLRECLESCVNQTLKDVEFICINDGSKDKSLEILNEYAEKDSRFIIITQENQGQGIARNKGIELARGETILFVDPDDFIETNAFEILYKKYEETNVEIVQFDYEAYRKDIKKPNRIVSIQECYERDLNLRLENNQIFSFKDIKNIKFESIGLAVWNKLYSTKFIKENNIKFAPNKHAEDHIFSLKSMILANNILYLSTPLYHYRERIGSAVNKASDDNFCIFDNMKLFKDFLIEYNLFDKYQKEYHQYICNLCAWHYTCIPFENLDKYLNLCKEVLLEEGYKKFLKLIDEKHSFFENIFSIKNKKLNGKKTKYVRILGFNFISESKNIKVVK